jgi:hypothetical protein
VLVVAEQAVLINQMRNRRLEFLFINAEESHEELLILLDCAQENAPDNLTVLIFANNLPYRFGIFLPYFVSDKGRVCKHKIKVIVKVFRNVFGMIKVVLIIIRVVFLEFDIELSY